MADATDVPESREEHARITSQQQQVEAIMADAMWHTLPGLVKEMKQRFGRTCTETAVSARLRDMRKRGWNVTTQPRRPGSKLFQSRAEKKTDTAASYADQVFGQPTANAQSEAAA
jgi:hypothetical protein